MRTTSADWESYAHKTFSSIIRAHYYFTVWRNYKLLLHGLSIQQGTLLELGSSTGQISLRLSKKYNLKPTLVDSSVIALEYAKKIYSNSNVSLEVLCKNISDLSLNKCYDFVHSHGLLEHFREREQKIIFYNHVRHTSLGGWLVCWVPTPDFFYQINRRYLEYTGQWIFGYEKALSAHDFVSLFEKEKLQIRKIRHLPGWLGVAAQKPSRLLDQ
ncbi:MAG: class I SAM-dependent methyltransferase [Candidatus Hodarchaeota archaeon]